MVNDAPSRRSSRPLAALVPALLVGTVYGLPLAPEPPSAPRHLSSRGRQQAGAVEAALGRRLEGNTRGAQRPGGGLPRASEPEGVAFFEAAALTGGLDLEEGAELEAAVYSLRESTDRASYCQRAEELARGVNRELPAVLDEDTVAIRTTAIGCHIVLSYQLARLLASEVTESGLAEMREQVAREACSDEGAVELLLHGGSFTSVYVDAAGSHIGQFAVDAGDCAEPSATQAAP